MMNFLSLSEKKKLHIVLAHYISLQFSLLGLLIVCRWLGLLLIIDGRGRMTLKKTRPHMLRRWSLLRSSSYLRPFHNSIV